MKLPALIAILIVAFFSFGDVSGGGPVNRRVAQRSATKADVERWMVEVSNWGRWGRDDQLGALNLITPEKRKRAAALVREGVSVSLARDTNKDPAPDNPQPYEHAMIIAGANNRGQFSADRIGVSFHGYQHTHLDALCHMFWQGKMYNGFSQEEVTQKGATRLGIDNVKGGILTRGVLIDIPKLKGVPHLEPGAAIYPEDLDAWEKKAGIKVTSGDCVFIRTGRWARRAALGPWNVSAGSAGLHASCAAWLKRRDVAIIGSDGASDVLPSGIEGVSHPIHLLALVAMGVHILDNCDLEALAKACSSRSRYEFLLTAAPIAVTGGTGSPLNPIATF